MIMPLEIEKINPSCSRINITISHHIRHGDTCTTTAATVQVAMVTPHKCLHQWQRIVAIKVGRDRRVRRVGNRVILVRHAGLLELGDETAVSMRKCGQDKQ